MSNVNLNALAIREHFSGWELDDETQEYLRFHDLRYEVLLNMVQRVIREARIDGEQSPLRILDIGASFQTQILRDLLPDDIVNTLGFEDHRFRTREQDRHISFDLNDAQNPELWPTPVPHDIVILSEVIEHLYTAPSLVLSCLATFLRPGGFLIVQTPNASALPKRIRLLMGQNPYEMIRTTRANPGHFREYTRQELITVAEASGFVLVEDLLANYFKRDTRRAQIFNRLAGFVPPTWRNGMLMLFRENR